jgi:hypothetical protein
VYGPVEWEASIGYVQQKQLSVLHWHVALLFVWNIFLLFKPVYQALLLVSTKEAHFVAYAEKTQHFLISYCQSAGQIWKTDNKSLQMLQIYSMWKWQKQVRIVFMKKKHSPESVCVVLVAMHSTIRIFPVSFHLWLRSMKFKTLKILLFNCCVHRCPPPLLLFFPCRN